jgi:hypothetical protein
MGQPIRLIPVSELDAAPMADAPVRPLLESIRRHGILQPLLVRRVDSRYEVIAGRKRLFAASTLQMRAVPCLVQDVGKAEAAALADADNVRVPPSDAAETFDAEALDRALVAHAGAVRHCTEMSGDGTPLNGAALDLLRAHAWRAARLLDAARLARHGAVTRSRDRLLVAILSDAVDGFAPECRLAGVTVRLDGGDGALWVFDESAVLAGASGALLAMLPLLAGADRGATLTIRTSMSGGDLKIQFAQTSAAVSDDFARNFFAPAGSRPGGIAASVGALAAKALAHAFGGTAVFEQLPRGGCLSLSLTQAR